MIELLTPAQMAEADRLTIDAGTPGIVLMENAGRAVADAAARLTATGAPQVRVVAGPGNNGGDGFVAARLLAERGYPVRLLLVGDRSRIRGDAAIAAERWAGEVEPATPDRLMGAELIIDALFGAGLDRPVEGQALVMIGAINATGVPVLAVDLPSGTSGETGATFGEAVRASRTVTFFRRKPGHILLPGRLHCGPVEVADIGISPNVLNTIGASTFANAPSLWSNLFPVPKIDGHKYGRGHAVVVSGEMPSTGAARLAARGALRAGAGLVTIASPSSVLAINAAANLSIMVQQVDNSAMLSALLTDRRLNSIVLGPGGGVGPTLKDMVLSALAAPCACVLDADALTSFTGDQSILFSAIKQKRSGVILTPHEGEFARLFSNSIQSYDNTSKIDRAKHCAALSGAIVVLKGPDTVVAAPDGRVSIAENAPPWLATGGSGDVLAGMAAGLLAQGMPPFEAASAAVWLHGEAGNAAGPGLIAEDLPDALRGVYRQMFVDLGVWP